MLFIQQLYKNPSYFFMVCLIVIFSVCVHEFCHAWTAVREGDYTLEDHLTLNPLKQMGIMSLIMLALVGIAWGAVPVKRELLRSKRSLLKIALSGPIANFALLLISWLILFTLLMLTIKQNWEVTTVWNITLSVVIHFGVYNFVLCVFNLIPAPGLDGWIIASELFPKLKTVSSEWVKGTMLFIMLLAFVGVRFLFAAGEFVMTTAVMLAKTSAGV